MKEMQITPLFKVEQVMDWKLFLNFRFNISIYQKESKKKKISFLKKRLRYEMIYELFSTY
jgi:hypothetical protein